uniref:Protein YIF1 n=1 Tax=Corethrella appendiculata TaxID=1370023 RepID=U5EVY5_9DIPT
MNYNANIGARHPTGGGGVRKPKRVSDINAMGGPAISQQSYTPNVFDMTQQPSQQQQPASFPSSQQQVPIGNENTFYAGQPQQQMYPNLPPQPQQIYPNLPAPQPQQPQQQYPQYPQQGPGGVGGQFAQPFSMFQQPIVQDMAMQYGQKLADQGKELVNKEFEKYIPVTKLKYYFAVDNKYVINKLKLLFFPFTQKDWSLKYDHDNPVQPRYDINAPDLYIPMMAYITYIVLAGFVLGMQDRFSPEQLGIQASSALAYSIFELIVYTMTLYVANIPTTLKTLDLLALSGYKYAIIVFILIVSILLHKTGYYFALIYSSASLCLFLLRTLKAKVLTEPVQVQNPPSYDPYMQQQQQFEHSVGRKRKLYFLFLVTGLQPILAFWLTMHLIPVTATVASA